jgi:hypothetical protein
MSTVDIRIAAGRALDQLGLTADDVADRLRALGIKGEPKCENHCALAVHLGQLDGVADVDVLETFALIYQHGQAKSITVDLPEAVQVFVHRFDDGVYLDLIQVDTAAVAR